MRSSKKLKMVSLFSGAGGLDIGMERADFESISMAEIEPHCCASLRANKGMTRHCGRTYFSNAKIFEDDIRRLTGSDLSAGCVVDVLVGGPPCQSFSSAGKQLSTLDSRGTLVNEFVRIVDEIKPRAFLFENVRGIVTARDEKGEPGGVIRSIYRSLEALGYSCRAALLNAADYGAFQRRVRCFVIGVRSGLAPDFPQTTHSAHPNETPLFPLRPWNTLGQFLEISADKDPSEFVRPTAQLEQQLALLKDGSGLKSAGVAEPTRPGGHWGYRQGTFIADKALPARTVTGSSSQDWVRWNGVLRRLTLLEIKRLQGFPDDWAFCGSKSDLFKQVGNAVPTLFGEVLGESLRRHLCTRGPIKPPIAVPFPNRFEGYIAYTARDHSRNASSRKIHKRFEQPAD